ncbi:hypothetical protein [Sphingomonas hylomeconis]|uniref:Holin n=1 Tax=Sphingomonas hylomeconis TaxID=1395958 RepID=A0ABV7SSA8_9SPHN|nr:hypothetical protein [Sphingomonas hylomeconis]
MSFKDSWPAFCLMVFAVASGQIGRLGQKYERGAAIGVRQIVVELTMLPAFGSLGGAIAVEYRWPWWAVIASGICAGWGGFGTFRLLASVGRSALQQAMGAKAEPPLQ